LVLPIVSREISNTIYNKYSIPGYPEGSWGILEYLIHSFFHVEVGDGNNFGEGLSIWKIYSW